MDRNITLKNANIPKDLWDKCYVTEEGIIFTPNKDKTGEEVYQKWLKNKDKKVAKEPSIQDILNAKLIADNAELLKENKEQKKLNADLLLKIAMLGGKANV